MLDRYDALNASEPDDFAALKAEWLRDIRALRKLDHSNKFLWAVAERFVCLVNRTGRALFHWGAFGDICGRTVTFKMWRQLAQLGVLCERKQGRWCGTWFTVDPSGLRALADRARRLEADARRYEPGAAARVSIRWKVARVAFRECLHDWLEAGAAHPYAGRTDMNSQVSLSSVVCAKRITAPLEPCNFAMNEVPNVSPIRLADRLNVRISGVRSH